MELRISKYDPSFRSFDGSYQRDEWTSFSDIGRKFTDGILTFDLYRNVEDLYAKTILDFFRLSDILILEVVEIEIFVTSDSGRLGETNAADLSVGSRITLENLEEVVRLCLRETMWCKLRGANHSYLHFGYDYYVYVGATNNGLASWQPPIGIFAEPFLSPYANE